MSVIIDTPPSPIANRASQIGTRRGGFAPKQHRPSTESIRHRANHQLQHGRYPQVTGNRQARQCVIGLEIPRDAGQRRQEQV
jgi:hypothetical protein